MKTIYGAKNFPSIKEQKQLVVALGNFDGLHVAHKKIIDRAREIARARDRKCAVFLLDPHPAKVLFPESDLQLISTIKERAEVLGAWGVDYLIIEDFTREFSKLPPHDFVKNYLVGFLRAAEIITGIDYSFGLGGQGTSQDLSRWGRQLGYRAEVMPPVMCQGEVISSSLIRELIGSGDVARAAIFLGGHFTITGSVVRGEGRGRNLGYPTANLETGPGMLIPGNSVYLTLAACQGRKYFSLTNIGRKPTFGQSDKVVIEVHLMDFSGNLYGEELMLTFLNKIRKEKYFSGVDLLVKQIGADEKRAKELIAEKYQDMLQD
ncbi:MAG: bifunctional riboflavin kinase/FAD synthetase [Dethiobacteria bacterium]|jgi:riboflavin kinase/FMN adenylyltransferase